MHTITGKVIKEQVALGSKSERIACILATKDGNYILRLRNGHAYSDPIWDSLIGSTITVTGDVHINMILVDKWDFIK